MKKHSIGIQATDFKESNVELGRPPGMTEEECTGLHIFTDGHVCISQWRPSFWERLKILFTGRIWLGILSGQSQPPVWLQTNYPFSTEKPGE